MFSCCVHFLYSRSHSAWSKNIEEVKCFNELTIGKDRKKLFNLFIFNLNNFVFKYKIFNGENQTRENDKIAVKHQNVNRNFLKIIYEKRKTGKTKEFYCKN